MIWFNHRFSTNDITKIVKYYLNLIWKHRPSSHQYSKLFNTSTIKVSYSCIPNIKAEINKHIKTPYEKLKKKHPAGLWNCTKKQDIVLNMITSWNNKHGNISIIKEVADQLRLTNKSINRLSRFSQENRDIKKDLCTTFFEGRSITRTVLTQL